MVLIELNQSIQFIILCHDCIHIICLLQLKIGSICVYILRLRDSGNASNNSIQFAAWAAKECSKHCIQSEISALIIFVMMGSKLLKKDSKIPFGPYLAAGTLISLFTTTPYGGNYILNWYYTTMF